MDILITGSSGLLGQKLLTTLHKETNRLSGIDLTDRSLVVDVPHRYSRIDLTVRKTSVDAICEMKPQVIVHTAAMTAVDRCEQEKELCWNTNVVATENVVTAAQKIGARLIFISSDYVFDGKNGPYTEDSLPNPINFYGRSKLAAENIIRGADISWTIIRTIVLYGVGINTRASFVTWLLDQLRAGKPSSIVDDQWGNSAIADDLASGIDRIITLQRDGIFNIANHGYMSRFEFARLIADKFQLNRGLIAPISTAALDQPAGRPLHSGLDVRKAERELHTSFRTTEEALMLYKEQEKEMDDRTTSE